MMQQMVAQAVEQQMAAVRQQMAQQLMSVFGAAPPPMAPQHAAADDNDDDDDDDDDDDEFAFTFGNSKFGSSGNCGKSIVPNGVSILFCCCLSSDEGTSVSTARGRAELLLFAHPKEARL